MRTRTALRAGLLLTGIGLLPQTLQAVEFSTGGQINRVVMYIDNGNKSGTVHADNSVSGTRWRFQGEGTTDDDLAVGFLFETQLQSNPSNKITADGLDSGGIGGNLGSGNNLDLRHARVYARGSFGKLTIGQGSGAADGSAEADKSGTSVIQYIGSSSDLLGSMEYGTSGITVGEARDSFDGLGRSDNLRYDAAVDDFNFAASIGNGNATELSVRYVDDAFEAKLGVWDENDKGDGIKGSAISVSWIGESGLSLTGSLVGDDRAGDPNNIYFKIGYRSGDNAYGVDWSVTEAKTDGDGSSVSIAWVHQLMQGVEAYASYRVERLDDVPDAEDIDALAGGMRVKF